MTAPAPRAPTSRLRGVLDAIDAANSADPDALTPDQAKDLIYGQRMSRILHQMFPDAEEVLQIAARGQHIERWKLRRTDYPAGRSGYLDWRRDLARHHGTRVGALMHHAGYEASDIAQVGRMLRKEGLKRDARTQALEDVICVVFLRWYFTPFSDSQAPEKLLEIVQKTARKMSTEGRRRVRVDFDLPAEFAQAFHDDD